MQVIKFSGPVVKINMHYKTPISHFETPFFLKLFYKTAFIEPILRFYIQRQAPLPECLFHKIHDINYICNMQNEEYMLILQCR